MNLCGVKIEDGVLIIDTSLEDMQKINKVRLRCGEYSYSFLHGASKTDELISRKKAIEEIKDAQVFVAYKIPRYLAEHPTEKDNDEFSDIIESVITQTKESIAGAILEMEGEADGRFD